MITKLERLLRYHRQHVFDAPDATGDRHARALRRLKRTATFRALCAENESRAEQRASVRLLSMYA